MAAVAVQSLIETVKVHRTLSVSREINYNRVWSSGVFPPQFRRYLASSRWVRQHLPTASHDDYSMLRKHPVFFVFFLLIFFSLLAGV